MTQEKQEFKQFLKELKLAIKTYYGLGLAVLGLIILSIPAGVNYFAVTCFVLLWSGGITHMAINHIKYSRSQLK